MNTHSMVAPTSLGALSAGQQAQVRSLEGGHDFRSRAATLGFTTGAQIEVKQNYGHGPLLVAVRGALIALGRGEAAKILVRVTS